jgi:hypothetical protein
MASESQEREETERPNGKASKLRDLFLVVWMMAMLFAGGMLYPTVILPAATPVKGVLNAAGKPVGLDFILFYGAGSLAREGRAIAAYDNPALSAAESRAAGMKITGLAWPYPPGMLLFARAAASLPYLQALMLWVGIGVAGLALMVWRVSRLPLLLLPLALCPAATYAGMLGQVGLFAAALAGAGFLLLPRRPGLAGALLGILTLKIQLAVLIPFCLLAARQYRAFFAFLAAGAALQLLGLAYAGPAVVHAFLANANNALGHVAGSTELLMRHPTVFSAVVFAGALRMALPLQILASFATIFIVWDVWRRSEDLAARSLAWAAGLPLAVPYFFDYDLAVFVLPLAALAGRSRYASIGWVQAGVMSLLWALPPIIKPVTELIGVQFGPLAAAALLAYAAWLARQPEPAAIAGEAAVS